MFKVLWDGESLGDLKKIAITEATKIVKKVENYLAQDPKNLGKQLSAEYSGLYRYRYGNYRIIYQVLEQDITIIVVKVGHMSKVYKTS
jgi:mRNA interferase RelE/StbE